MNDVLWVNLWNTQLLIFHSLIVTTNSVQPISRTVETRHWCFIGSNACDPIGLVTVIIGLFSNIQVLLKLLDTLIGDLNYRGCIAQVTVKLGYIVGHKCYVIKSRWSGESFGYISYDVVNVTTIQRKIVSFPWAYQHKIYLYWVVYKPIVTIRMRRRQPIHAVM